MKRVILLILCFCLAASLLFSGCALKNDTAKPASKPGSILDQHDPDGTTETDSSEFDAGMMKYIEKSEKGNYVISPVSLKLVLGMLEAGANGETREQMLKALGTDAQTFDKNLKNFTRFVEGFNAFCSQDKNSGSGLESANSVWKYKGTKDFTTDYRMHLEAFEAEVKDFEPATVVKNVNDWCDGKTYGLIKNVLSEDFDASDLMILLINALYYKNTWLHDFVIIEEKQDFTTLDGRTVKKQYFTETEDFLYYSDDETTIVAVPMKGNVNMVLVKGPTDGLQEKLQKAEKRKVQLRVPSFHVETALNKNELVDFLKGRGMTDAFGGIADFSRMIDENIFVRDIIQKAVIDVTNTGVEAAAVTVIAVPGSAYDPEEPVRVFFDSAFHFFLMTENSEWSEDNFILFEGRVAE